MHSKYTNYFKHIGDEVKENIKYSIFQPYGFPLILKNYQGRVLASLQIFYDDEPIESQTYPIPIPYEDTFQVIFQCKNDDERIEKGRPIKYVITKQCEEEGYVKIDLGFNKVPSCETDPPENINSVNELRSFKPFEVKSNQLDNWKELIVKTKKVKQADGSYKSVSFDEETKTEESQKVGSYLYITVTPQNNSQLVELFKNTYWTTDEFIVIEMENQNMLKALQKLPNRPHLLHHDQVLRPMGLEQIKAKNTNLVKGRHNIHHTPYLSRRHVAFCDDDSDDDCVDLHNVPKIYQERAEVHYDVCAVISDDSEKSKVETSSRENVGDIDKSLEGIDLMTTKEAIETTKKDIMISKVAELSSGERIIRQSGNKTFASYDYGCRTEPRKIGMSIMNLNITKIYTDMTKDEILLTINEYLENIEKSKSIEIIELAKSIKKFRADVCTICLGDPPNTILVRCGHICTCSKDCTDMLGDNCPMCRSKILHRIDESIFSLTE